MSKLIVTPLGELTLYINRGVAPAYIEDSSEASISVVNQKCIRNGQINFSYARRHNELKREILKEKRLQKFDVLVNSTGTGTVGRVAQVLNEQKSTVDTHVTIVRPDKTKVDPRYFGHLLEWHQKELESLAEGSSNQVELSRDKIAHLRIPVLPRSSQHVVADILDASNNAILATQKIIDQTEKLKKSLLYQFFGAIKNTNYHTLSMLGDLSYVTKLAGYEYTKYFNSYQDGGEIIVLRGKNLKGSTLDLTDIKTIPKKTAEFLVRSQLKAGDIVFSYVGTIGPVALIEKDNTFHLGPNIAKISVDPSKLSPEFLMQYFQSTLLDSEVTRLLSVTAQPSLSMEKIRDFRVPLIPISDQIRIASILSSVDTYIKKLYKLQSRQNLLKDSLTQDLLTGKVQV